MCLRAIRLPLASMLLLLGSCTSKPALAPVDSCASATAPARRDGTVVVSYGSRGCFSGEAYERELRPLGDSYASESLVVPRSLIEAARAAVFASRDVELDVLTDLGLEAEHLEAAPAKIAATLLSASWYAERTTIEEWTPLVTESLTREEIVRRLEGNVDSGRALFQPVAARRMTITLPGNPPIQLSHTSFSPFYLPWRVVAGDDEWTTTDMRLTRAVAPLIWTDRSFDEFVAQWREQVFVWYAPWHGLDLHAELVLHDRLHTGLLGFAEACVDWQVEKSEHEVSSLWDGEMLRLELRAQRARHVDAVRWFMRILERGLANDWNDLLELADEAERAVAARPWLVKWKAASSAHSLELQAVGARPHVPQRIDTAVLQAWRDAGFLGSPHLEFVLHDNGEPRATVYLSGGDASGLVLASGPQLAPGHTLFDIASALSATSYFDADGKAHALR